MIHDCPYCGASVDEYREKEGLCGRCGEVFDPFEETVITL